MDINVHFGRKVQVVKYEDSVDYGVSVTDSLRVGHETPGMAARRIGRFTAQLFNEIEEAVLVEHGIEDKAEPLSLGEGEVDDTTEETASVETATPPRRKRKK